jgi:hypothetical protein
MPVISFKVSAEHARHLRRAARLKHKTVSEYLRDTTKPETPRPPKMIIKKHPVSGLSYNAAPGQPDYTIDQLKEMLADFP